MIKFYQIRPSRSVLTASLGGGAELPALTGQRQRRWGSVRTGPQGQHSVPEQSAVPAALLAIASNLREQMRAHSKAHLGEVITKRFNSKA